MTIIYGTVLVVLGCWGTFTTARTFASPGGWTQHRTLVLIGAAFVASCLLPGVALLAGAFDVWMLIPLGACYVALIPLPCYFRWANHGWIRTVRGVLFLLLGGAFVAIGIRVLPVSWFGL